ncbi:unnamed protein product [Fraxinus pennsylvanica]|uniref:Uncharacterized protein n=1 Tax=Fraxinus pennsylvanica TaxID=56036 RepID=A0AAD1YNE6_9LAMI|nr:unnamed protein product [Fraxinus pennsylvanica]
MQFCFAIVHCNDKELDLIPDNLESEIMFIVKLELAISGACIWGIYSLSTSSVLLSDIWKLQFDPSWVTRAMSLINSKLTLQQLLAAGKRFYCRPSTGNLINMIGGET